MKGRQSVIAIGATEQQFLGPSPDRVSIILPSVPGVEYTATPDSLVTDRQGIVVQAGTLPVVIHMRDYGDLVQMPWRAISHAGSVTVEVMEVFR